MDTFLQTIFNLGSAIFTVMLPIIGALAGKLLHRWIAASNTQMDDRAAAVIVAWVEDQYKGGKGEIKRDAATKKLVEWSKGRLKKEDAEGLVRAAFQAGSNAGGPLKKG